VPLEPPESRVVTLPGGKPVVRAPRPAPHLHKPLDLSIPPRPASAPLLPDGPAVEAATTIRTPAALADVFEPELPADPRVPELPAPPDVEAPPAGGTLPATLEPTNEFEIESALYLQKQIGRWVAADANASLGNPLRQRPAVDDQQAPNGTIYAFADPSGRYREIELDFDAANGMLRTVFAYPWKMSWEECHTRFSGQVNASKANKGRMFYSYANRRLDVLVEASGQVVSLGLY